MKKYILLILLVALLTIVGCAQRERAVVSVTVLHWNDFHSQNLSRERIREGDTLHVGGINAVAGYINHYRDKYERTLVLNAGDEFQGTPISEVTKGKSQVDLLNVVKPDAFTIGNHEFDYGVENLVDVFNEANFPVLLGNILSEENGKPLFPADTVLDVNGVKIGIIGVVTDHLMQVTTSKATEGVKLVPSEDIVRSSLEKLSPISDIQIALTHLGVWEDSILASKIGPELELIVGGHSHTALFEPKMVNGVTILQAGGKGGFLGIAELEIDTVSDELVAINSRLERVIVGTYPEDDQIVEIVSKQEEQLSSEFDKEIATLVTPWERNYNGESNVGNWITDVYREYTETDIAFVNSGGLRKNVDAGEMTVRDLFEVSPFNNELVKFEMTGEEIMEYADKIASKEIRQMQVSGLKIHAQGNKVVDLKINGDTVVPSRIYTISTVDYVTDHIKKYFGLEKGSKEIRNLYFVGRDILISAARDSGNINSKVEGRIIIE